MNGTLAVYRLVQMSTKVSVVAPLEAVEEIIEEMAERTREVQLHANSKCEGANAYISFATAED